MQELSNFTGPLQAQLQMYSEIFEESRGQIGVIDQERLTYILTSLQSDIIWLEEPARSSLILQVYRLLSTLADTPTVRNHYPLLLQVSEIYLELIEGYDFTMDGDMREQITSHFNKLLQDLRLINYSNPLDARVMKVIARLELAVNIEHFLSLINRSIVPFTEQFDLNIATKTFSFALRSGDFAYTPYLLGKLTVIAHNYYHRKLFAYDIDQSAVVTAMNRLITTAEKLHGNEDYDPDELSEFINYLQSLAGPNLSGSIS